MKRFVIDCVTYLAICVALSFGVQVSGQGPASGAAPKLMSKPVQTLPR